VYGSMVSFTIFKYEICDFCVLDGLLFIWFLADFSVNSPRALVLETFLV
jgi:hypothetical protein